MGKKIKMCICVYVCVYEVPRGFAIPLSIGDFWNPSIEGALQSLHSEASSIEGIHEGPCIEGFAKPLSIRTLKSTLSVRALWSSQGPYKAPCM